MARWNLEEAQRRLQLYLDAEEAILLGNQEYSIADRTFKRADLGIIRERINYWANEVERLEAGNAGGPVFRTTRIKERPSHPSW
jgi:hypothetical protein